MPTPNRDETPRPAAGADSERKSAARRAERTASRDSTRQESAAPRARPAQDTTQLLKPAAAPAARAARRQADAGSTGIRGHDAPTTAAADPRPAERSPRTGPRRGPATP